MNRGDTVPANRYQVSGDRQGKVTVRDILSGEVIRTFQMDEGVVVRETFLLDNGRTVGASQKDHAVFWQLATGEEIHRFDRRIYGFSHDETRFFTYEYPQRGVFLYSYPNMTLICKLSEGTAGPAHFRFSPDDRFLVIRFFTGFPATDENYPRANPGQRGFMYTKLFNIQICQEIQEFSRLDIKSLGEFSQDSRFYDIKDTLMMSDSGFLRGSWRFDLTTYEVNQLTD